MNPSYRAERGTCLSAAPTHRQLRRAAAALSFLLAACTPAQRIARDCPSPLPDLVDLRTLTPAPALEVRYATEDNFTGARLAGYEEARALLRPAAAAALERVARRLAGEGLGVKVWDAYRPRRASEDMVAWAERTGNRWVIEEGYVAPESGHNRGATIDLTLIRLDTGQELEMGTAYDEFAEAAHTGNASGEVLANRLRLVQAMAAEGWENYPLEWWHFSLPVEHPPLDVPLGCFP